MGECAGGGGTAGRDACTAEKSSPGSRANSVSSCPSLFVCFFFIIIIFLFFSLVYFEYTTLQKKKKIQTTAKKKTNSNPLSHLGASFPIDSNSQAVPVRV